LYLEAYIPAGYPALQAQIIITSKFFSINIFFKR
jgi:hypothetical protein